MANIEEEVKSLLENNANTLDLNNDDFNHATPIDCNYFTENQFIDEFQNTHKHEVTVLHLNIRSMHKNVDAFNNLTKNFRDGSAVMGVTETWFSSESDIKLYSIPGYNLVSNHRLDKRGGGVALYIPAGMEFQIRHDLNVMSDQLETLFVESFVPGKKNVIFGVIYRPPQSNLDQVVNELQTILLNPLFLNKTIFLMGDFNTNLLQCEENFHTDAFFNIMLSFSLMPLIIKPTRVTETSSTLIDNIFCNIQPFPSAGIIISDISDHFPIFTKVDLQNNRYNCSQE